MQLNRCIIIIIIIINNPLHLFCSLDHAFSNYDERKPTKCIFKVNNTFRISILLLHVSALQEQVDMSTDHIAYRLHDSLS
jgi:hypothetical protein